MSKLFKSRRVKSSKSSNTLESTKKQKTSLKTKFINRTMHWNYAKITRYFMVLGVILAVITSYVWYTNLYMTPERRFWTAINNSMATPSVVRTLTQGGTGNQVVQQYRFNFAPQRVVQNKVVYTEKSATTDTSVTTEGVIYPVEQYLRYTQFINSRSDGENSANLDSILGKWAIQTSDNEEESKLSYLSEQVSLVIFGNYGPNIRKEVLSEMQKTQVYGSEISVPLEDNVDGETVLVYSVSVKLKDYARILNNAFISAGYGAFEPLNPDNYEADALVNGKIIVDNKNNSIIGVTFGGREERYGNYGVTATVEKPQADMTVEELQQQVQELLQTAL